MPEFYSLSRLCLIFQIARYAYPDEDNMKFDEKTLKTQNCISMYQQPHSAIMSVFLYHQNFFIPDKQTFFFATQDTYIETEFVNIIVISLLNMRSYKLMWLPVSLALLISFSNATEISTTPPFVAQLYVPQVS